MENLTHSLVGLLLARSGLNRLAPGSTALCIVAANMPDIDIVSGVSPEAYIEYHRHLTHAVAAIPAMALAAVFLTAWGERAYEYFRGTRLARRPPWRRQWLVALLPAASHPLLDMTNSYGMRPWLPFSRAWQSWDAIFIIDLFVWAILITASIAPWLASRAGFRSAFLRPAVSGAGLLLLAGYMGSQAVAHDRILASLPADGALRAAVFPAPLPFEWRGYVERNPSIEVYPAKVGPGGVEIEEPELHRPLKNDPAVQAAWNTSLGRVYARFARYPFEQIEKTPEGKRVILSDYRFLRHSEGDPAFGCTFLVDENNRVVESSFGM